MAAPLVKKDSFFADLFNSLLMRSLYRVPKTTTEPAPTETLQEAGVVPGKDTPKTTSESQRNPSGDMGSRAASEDPMEGLSESDTMETETPVYVAGVDVRAALDLPGITTMINSGSWSDSLATYADETFGPFRVIAGQVEAFPVSEKDEFVNPPRARIFAQVDGREYEIVTDRSGNSSPLNELLTAHLAIYKRLRSEISSPALLDEVIHATETALESVDPPPRPGGSSSVSRRATQ
ncbi:hypothetical protein GM708_06575 [Vibrio cholerae]|nr:hypothetical protein [Vibrio cholerae]